MRTVNFRDDIIYGMAGLLGIDPTADLNNDHVGAWVGFVNSRLRYGWEFWPWPEFTVTEERALRTIWNSDRISKEGAELFYIPTMSYYRAIADAPAGVLPTNTSYFEAATLNDFYIALNQVGQRAIGEVMGLYAGNPRLNGASFMWPLNFRPSEKGIDFVPYGSGPTVFVKYRPPPSAMTWKPWDATVVYNQRAVVYSPERGNCYRALVKNVGTPVTEAGFWTLQPVPYVLGEFIKYAAAADASDDAVRKVELNTLAEGYLYREIDKLSEQGEIIRYPRRQRCGYLSFAPMGAPWFVSPPWVSSSVTTLTDVDADGGTSVTTTEDDDMKILEDGSTPLVNGQDYVDVVFQIAKPSNSYRIVEARIENFIDDPPIEIWATTFVSRTPTGFRAILNTTPDNANYSLRWRVTS